MKTLHITIIFTVVAFMLLFSHEANAQIEEIILKDGQVVDCSREIQIRSDVAESLDTILEEDYPYLRKIECLKNGYFANHNLNLTFRDVSRDRNNSYKLEGHGNRIDVEARYDNAGNLVNAKLVTKNVQIPLSIRQFIYSNDEFDGWIMTGNEKEVTDFDPSQTVYKVTLSNGSKEQVLHFENRGNSIAYMHR